MFIGHFAIAFASKAAAPRVSLAPLLVAPLALDMLWPIFLVLGIETVRIVPGDTAVTPLDLHDYPWSHSLVMSLVWAALAALLGWMALRQILAALVLGAGVFSHFILDFISHRPDLPLWPGSATYLGLGLWNSKLATALVEVPLFAIGVWLYCRSTRPTSKAGTINLVAMVALLGLLYVGNLTGPPPPSVKALIIAAFASWIFIPWAWFIDRRRGPPIRA